MKNSNKIIIYLIFLFLLFDCKSHSKFTYWNMNQQKNEDLIAEKEYVKIAPNNLTISQDFILIKLNISGFKDRQVILNDYDTISFKNLGVDCGEINRRISKSNKSITLKMNQDIITIPIKNNYNFIKIQGINNHKWNIIYSQFFPKFECL